jgi:UDP-glucose 4-epimerase
MKTVCITGGAGFIGSHLCQSLINDNYVICIDNLSRGNKKNLSSIIDHPNFKFYERDITGQSSLDEIFLRYNIDVVFHLAANSDISVGNVDREYLDTFITTANVLQACKDYNVKELVFASSGAVYGETEQIVNENSPCLPISYYAAAKLASEAFISAYCHNTDLKAWICRFPNVVGSHATHGVILDFVNKLQANPKELLVLGDGHQTKPYVHVSNLIEAMLYIWRNAKEKVNIYNIAGVNYTSVTTIADQVILHMGLKGKTNIFYTPGDRGWKGDCPIYRCTTSKLKGLGFELNVFSDVAVNTAIHEIINEMKL